MIRWRTRRRTTTTVRSPLVLCYHAVSPTWEHRLSIQPDLLLSQVRVLSLLRTVRVTFDDAFTSAGAVFPQLHGLGVSVQIFVCTGYALDGAPLAVAELEGDDPAELATMDWDALRVHAEQGVAIGSHTVSHPHLPRLSDIELLRELSDSKAEIEAQLGRACTELAYPYGEHDERVRAAARAAGYGWAFALWGGRRGDPYALPRLDLYRRHTPARALLMTTPLHRRVA
jgi:peptidoglycan/xylan/chitin deacetylase (PgdA/CDA1 family)